MNFFADQLTQVLASMNASRRELAERFDIPASNLSQFCSGKEVCGQKQLSKILSKLPEDLAEDLAVAWLKDQLPSEIGPGRIQISLTSRRTREQAETEFPETDTELKTALSALINRANRHPEIRTALLSFASALRGANTRQS